MARSVLLVPEILASLLGSQPQPHGQTPKQPINRMDFDALRRDPNLLL